MQLADIPEIRRQVEVVCGKPPPTATCFPLRNPCLFDIREDPCEYHNLADSSPQVVQELLHLLHRFNETAVPPLNTQSDPRSNPKYWNYTYTNWADYV